MLCHTLDPPCAYTLRETDAVRMETRRNDWSVERHTTKWADDLLRRLPLPHELCRLVAGYAVGIIEFFYAQAHEPRQVAERSDEVFASSTALPHRLCRLIAWYAWTRTPCCLVIFSTARSRHRCTYLSLVRQGDSGGLVLHYLGWSRNSDEWLHDNVDASRCFPPLFVSGPLPSMDRFVCAANSDSRSARRVARVRHAKRPTLTGTTYVFRDYGGEVEFVTRTDVSESAAAACTKTTIEELFEDPSH